MSGGYSTAAPKEAVRLICDHDRMDTEDLGRHLVNARGSSTTPGFAPAIARMAATLAGLLGVLSVTGRLLTTGLQRRMPAALIA
ncbi:hypothetical protein, partial [Streptosporangium roseum]|uniref:hypothetical protein n=1 Tax=Streptosporangium roseum TaxID=2001 RepID=UPI0004CC9770